MKFITIFIIMALANSARASQLPFDNYNCKSIATFIVDEKYEFEDVKEQVIGYILTPN